MKNLILILLILSSSCIESPDQPTTVNLTITQELFGNAPLGLRVVTWSDFAEPQGVPNYFDGLPTNTERERTLSTTTQSGEPFVLILENKHRYTRLRIDVDRTGQRPVSLLSIPEVGDRLHILIFNNGDKQRTEQLETIIQEATQGLQGYVIRRANY